MAGEIQLNSTTFATESGGTVTVSNVDSATNRTNLGLGSIATQNANAVALTGGSLTGTEIDLKSSGDTIYASNGTTALLSESGGIVTFKNSTIDTTAKVNDGHTTDTINKFVAKAWANFQYQSSTFTQNSNFNLTITRSSTGSYYGTFTNAMSNDDYAVVISSQVTASYPRTINLQQGAKSTTRTGTITFNENGASVDPNDCSIVVFGD